VPATSRKIAPSRRRLTVAPSSPLAFRFGLKSLMIVLAIAGVLSAVARSLVRNDPTIFLGIGAFCYGGIVALPCYAFVGSLMVLTTTTTRGQRAGEIFAAIVGAAAWIGFVVVMLGQWPQLCVVYSVVIVAIIVWLMRLNWKPVEGPSPEPMLKRLMQAKRDLPHREPHDNQHG
jgi:MFS family permease